MLFRSSGALNVVFTPPAGCNALPEKTMASAFRGVPVKYACVTPGEGTAVFVTVSEMENPEKGFPDFERGFKDGVREVSPAVQFKRRTVSLNGTKWVGLRYTTQAAGGSAVSNDAYMISWAGYAVLFNFFTPAPKYEARRAALEESAKSIGLSISAFAPAETPGPKNN